MLGPTHRLGGIAVGALTAVVVEKVFNMPLHDPLLFAAVTMAGAAIGSLIPDIDSPSSTIGRRMKPVSKFIAETMGHRGATHTIVGLLIFILSTTFLGKFLEKFLMRNMTNENKLIFSFIVAIIMSSSILFLIQNIPLKVKKFKKKHRFILVVSVFVITMFIAFAESLNLLNYLRVYLLGMSIGYASHIVLDMFTRAGVPFFKPLSKYRISFTNFRTGSGIEEFTKVLSTVIAVICVIYLGGIQI